ncbi:MAG: hypothetical protein E7Z73_07845 [Methanobrevibacter millerae]|uniref:Uncharacterized protein n=1 Tax=Methanobrevibacter millerae TaxID=230361 RepID=A0A8T3VK43_9EURY|nr:hypothetical protein [Methanobrevibacter millerae]MBE6505633.1 hypothetical protein [Methanobrevibacter millerae]
MSRLHFRDIQDWTPASISIVDKPYHPLATFEVYENDDEFIKKYVDTEVDKMSQNNTPTDDNVTLSGSFMERLLDKIVAKSEPAPGETDSVSKEILEKLNSIEENQAKTDERLAKLENPEPADQEPTPNPEGDEGDESNEDGEPTTVELPLNDDGTLNIEDEVVVKYLPRNYTPSSQSVDPDLVKGNKPDKSFNARSGRNSNGMTW